MFNEVYAVLISLKLQKDTKPLKGQLLDYLAGAAHKKITSRAISPLILHQLTQASWEVWAEILKALGRDKR